eukprot:1157645-Pelagomonas_calceolata.AAC.9
MQDFVLKIIHRTLSHAPAHQGGRDKAVAAASGPRGLEAVLDSGYPLLEQQEKGGFSNLHHMTSAPGLQLLLGYLIMLRCQILRWGTGGACWWGDPSGRVCKPMQEVTLLRYHWIPWQPERNPGCCLA